MSHNTKLLVILLAIVLILGGGYLLFFNTNSTPSAVSESEGTPTSAAQVDFINLTNQINPITFDTTILTDPRFVALVNIHTAILPEATGRTNPFAPLGSQ